MVAKKTAGAPLEIHTVKQGRIKLRMVGQTPLYFNSMGAKAWRDLLVGAGKKTAAEKKELKTLIESFQTANGYGLHNSSQGLCLNDGYHTNTIPTCYAVWQMNWGQKGEISTKLRLQTMGGDFDVYKLIEELTAEFSS